MEKKMKKCYIVGAGEFYGNPIPCEEDLVIAADGGLDCLLKLGITPDVIVGDFDSLQNELEAMRLDEAEEPTRVQNKASDPHKTVINGKSVRVYRHPVMKNETDMYLAYKIGASLGYSEFELYGGVGGREDHTFANYCLLLDAKNDNNNLILVGNGTKSFVIKNEKKRVFGVSGATVSVFAFGGGASGVSIKGLKYEAENVTLSPEFPLGVSNSFTESGEGEISVKSGALLVMVYC